MDDPDTQPTILQAQNKTNKTEQISITSRSKVEMVYCLFCRSFSSYVCTHASCDWLEGYEKRLKEVIKSEAVSRGSDNTMSKQWY